MLISFLTAFFTLRMSGDKDAYLAQLIGERKNIFEKKLKEFTEIYKEDKEVSAYFHDIFSIIV